MADVNRLVIERKDDARGWVQVFEATDAEYRVGGRVRYRLRGPAVENPWWAKAAAVVITVSLVVCALVLPVWLIGRMIGSLG